MFSKKVLFDTKQAYDMLGERKKQLEQLIREKKKSLENRPAGRLHIVQHGNQKPQFYLRENPSDKSGTYIRKENCGAVRRMAQCEYDEKIVRIAEQELNGIDRLLKYAAEDKYPVIYENYRSARQDLIDPIEIGDERFAAEWQAEEYEHSHFHEDTLIFTTNRKEKVRSKSEVIIANMLDNLNVPYRYEYPIYRNGSVAAWPDFAALNKKNRRVYYWEHFGMMDDPEYLKNALYKINRYQKIGCFPGENILFSFESSVTAIDTEAVEAMIRKYLL